MGRRTVSISDEVYGHVADRGRFGESFDEALRRLLHVRDEAIMTAAAATPPRPGQRISTHVKGVRGPNLSTRRLSPCLIRDGVLILGWDGVEELRLRLPDKTNRKGIEAVVGEAKRWATPAGASHGQLNAIDKTLSDGGYYRRGPRR
jgi:predicted CopG family antitoxin